LILDVAVIFLAVLWVASVAMFMAHTKRLRIHATQQLEADSLRDQRIRELARRLENYQSGTVRMGEELHELRSIIALLPDKITALEQRDPSTLSFAQAARLVGMGASIDELTQSCGLTQAEAQLMTKVHGHNR
jgi:hypothetical protein